MAATPGHPAAGWLGGGAGTPGQLAGTQEGGGRTAACLPAAATTYELGIGADATAYLQQLLQTTCGSCYSLLANCYITTYELGTGADAAAYPPVGQGQACTPRPHVRVRDAVKPSPLLRAGTHPLICTHYSLKATD